MKKQNKAPSPYSKKGFVSVTAPRPVQNNVKGTVRETGKDLRAK